MRSILRERKAKQLKELFTNLDLEYITVHWDGKMIDDANSGKKVESYENTEKIINAPILKDQKATNTFNSIYESLENWEVLDLVLAVCADTTNTNFGCRGGAAILLEQKLERDWLYLPCRHHIFELVLSIAFTTKIPGSSGPNVPILINFRKKWSTLNLNVENGLEGLEPELVEKKQGIIDFIKLNLQNQQPRDDYEELLELSLLFLGVEVENIRLRRPGAFHHARWMSKLNYTLKVYLLRNSFDLGDLEAAMLSICKFIVFVYLKQWFTAPVAQQFLKDLDLTFLSSDCGTWEENKLYTANRDKLKEVPVINDRAERGVKLMEECANSLITDESQKQSLLQVVEDYNKRFKDSTKKTVVEELRRNK
ncbi:hypothetical protein TKK_0018258 [Trichogramma kaykai]